MLDGAKPCSAADWADLAKHEILAAHSAGKLPILAGGTGLYLRTLIEGIAPVPPIDPNVRKEVREAPVGDNLEKLKVLDPEAATRLNPADTTRISRALEVALATGKTLAQWQEHRKGGIGSGIELRPLILLPPREWLYRRCDERFANMIECGAAEEVQALIDRQLAPGLPIMRAIGVREITLWLQGQIIREEAIASGQQATRRYAKRQYTWFSNQPPQDWPRFHDMLDGHSVEAALALLRTKP